MTAPGEALSASFATDLATVTGLLGRVPNGEFVVVVRRKGGRPAVIANAPHLRDGEPMPTRYWLVDPDIRALVSRLESNGGVRQAERDVDPELLRQAHARYAEERDALIPTRLVRAAPAGWRGRDAQRRQVPACPCGLVVGRG